MLTSPVTRIAPVASESAYKDKRANKTRAVEDAVGPGINGSENMQSSVASSGATTVVATVPREEDNSLQPSATVGNASLTQQEQGQHAPVVSGANVLIIHPTDLQVKPIVGNKTIEIIDVPTFKSSSLPCRPLTLDEVAKLSQDDLEAHLTILYKALLKFASPPQSASTASSSATGDKVNILGTHMLCN
jgi:hypothetical protein